MDWPVFMTGTTETWRKGRKLLDRSLRPGAMISYRQMIQKKTREFLAQLCATPKDFEAHVGLSVDCPSRIVQSLTAGQPSRETSHVTHVRLRSEGW